MIRPFGVRILPISGLLTKTSSAAYAAETARIPGNGTRSSLFYIVQKSPLTLSPGVPTPWVDGSIAPAGASETSSQETLSSSRQSVSLRISPPSRERRGFSAILAAVRGGSVVRDAQSPATSRRGGVVSLRGDIPVPQCCRRRLARLARSAANEAGLAISVGLEFGSAQAKPSRVR